MAFFACVTFASSIDSYDIRWAILSQSENSNSSAKMWSSSCWLRRASCDGSELASMQINHEREACLDRRANSPRQSRRFCCWWLTHFARCFMHMHNVAWWLIILFDCRLILPLHHQHHRHHHLRLDLDRSCERSKNDYVTTTMPTRSANWAITDSQQPSELREKRSKTLSWKSKVSVCWRANNNRNLQPNQYS